MFNKIRRLDEKKELDGVWVDFDDEIKFKVAKWENPLWTVKLLSLMKPYQQRLQRGKELEPDVYSGILNKVVAETILLDWSGLEEEYSVENALALLSDPALKHVKEHILEQSQNVNLFYQDRVEEGIEQAKKS